MRVQALDRCGAEQRLAPRSRRATAARRPSGRATPPAGCTIDVNVPVEHPRRGPRPARRRPAGARGRQARRRAARRDLQGHERRRRGLRGRLGQLPLPGRRGRRRRQRERRRLGDVPATLALGLGGPAQLGTLQPGVARDYTADLAATVTSTAGDAALGRPRPERDSPGHLVNGSHMLAAGAAGEGGRARSPRSRGEQPDAAAELDAPVSRPPVTIGLKQASPPPTRCAPAATRRRSCSRWRRRPRSRLPGRFTPTA